MDLIRDTLANTKIRITAAVAVVLLLVVGGMLVFLRSQPQNADSQDDTIVVENADGSEREVLQRDYPDVEFSNYSFETENPVVDTPVQSFVFQTTFTRNGAENLATQFGFSNTEIDTINNYFVVRDPEGKRVLNYDASNGTYYMYDGTPSIIESESANPLILAETFLEQTGLQDTYTRCTHWYKIQDTPDTTFVECHRDWDAVGYPILNTLGAMNLPSGYSLGDLQLGMVFESGPKDDEIIVTSDGRPGLARPNQFNTYTLALRDRSVVALTSTMRPLERVDEQEASLLKTPEEAKAELEAERNELTLVWPAGEGVVDLDKVYQDKRVVSDSVVVRDFILAYLEEPLDIPQQSLVPAYLFKGTATLENGFEVEFMDVVPAIKGETQVLGVTTGRELAQTLCGPAESIQYCTFTFGQLTPTLAPTNTPAPTITPVPTVPTILRPTNTPVPPQPTDTPIPTIPPDSESCPEYDREVILPNGVKVAYSTTLQETQSRGEFYYVPKQSELLNDPNNLPENVQHCDPLVDRVPGSNRPTPDISHESRMRLIRQCAINTLVKAGNDIQWARDIRILCQPSNASPCALTSPPEEGQECYPFWMTSPHIYMYGHTNDTVVSIDQPGRVSYAHPPAGVDQSWIFEVGEHKVYYEYEKSDIVEALEKMRFENGYQVQRDELASLIINKIGPKLGLTQEEVQDWVGDIQRETHTMTAENVEVYFVPEGVLDTHLPLRVHAAGTTMYRLHLYVVPSNMSKQMSEPAIEPIVRDGVVMLETGIVTPK